MADYKHQELSSFIKHVHQSLRYQSSLMGFHKAWQEHCSQKGLLKEYACAMRDLATQYWDKNAKDEKKGVICRVQWIISHILDYFNCDILQEREKENKKIIHFQKKFSSSNMSSDYLEVLDFPLDCFNVLDVGSCYNPFSKFPFLNVIPIDIAPASDDVFCCDFLSTDVVESNDKLFSEISKLNCVTCLPKNYFHVVIFSLLLEYLPAPEQRFLCCLKAHSLLQPEGLLFIITPDSKHKTANSSMMKNWRITLAKIGFYRVYYEKLPHLHCMAFRKCLNETWPKLWATQRGNQNSSLEENVLNIPQDFSENNTYLKNEEACSEKTWKDEGSVAALFTNLPSI